MNHKAVPANIITNNNEVFSPNKLQIAIDNQYLPSSPLDEIGFQNQINRNQKHEPSHVTEELLVSNEAKGLDAIGGLDRRFSMVSIESSATTGRLLDHLELGDDEEEIDWTKYNENLFNNNNNNTINNNIQRGNQQPHGGRNFFNNRMESRNQMLKTQLLEKRLPLTPQPTTTTTILQKRSQNFAPADKFPSLQRRFLKPRLSEDSSHSRKNSLERLLETELSPKLKSPALNPSPFSTPRKFAKDFSDQFEMTSPQRKERKSPIIEKKLQFSTPVRPKHVHSISNPVNLLSNKLTTTTTPQRAGTIQSTTPSPKQTLQRTPSTPVSRGTDTLDTNKLIFAKADEISPETRVNLAIELKRKNQPQEASYQLQLAAEQGNKDAMLLYGLSLRYGYGVKKDPRQSFLWLCRAADIDLIRTYKFEIDPFELGESHHQFPAKPEEPLSSTLLEIGKSYMNGWGVERDENYGIQFIEKSASLGFAEAMLEAGNIWSTKGPNRKKNMHRSASWYRLADKFGKKLVGNSWIYKSKYMERV